MLHYRPARCGNVAPGKLPWPLFHMFVRSVGLDHRATLGAIDARQSGLKPGNAQELGPHVGPSEDLVAETRIVREVPGNSREGRQGCTRATTVPSPRLHEFDHLSSVPVSGVNRVDGHLGDVGVSIDQVGSNVADYLAVHLGDPEVMHVNSFTKFPGLWSVISDLRHPHRAESLAGVDLDCDDPRYVTLRGFTDPTFEHTAIFAGHPGFMRQVRYTQSGLKA